MARRTPAQAVRAALDRLLKQRESAAERLAKLDDEIAEIQTMLGIQTVTLPAQAAAPGRPAMAGERPAVDPKAPKKSLDQMMREAKDNPAPPGASPDERPPFVPHDERGGLPELSADGVAPADNQGAGRWM